MVSFLRKQESRKTKDWIPHQVRNDRNNVNLLPMPFIILGYCLIRIKDYSLAIRSITDFCYSYADFTRLFKVCPLLRRDKHVYPAVFLKLKKTIRPDLSMTQFSIAQLKLKNRRLLQSRVGPCRSTACIHHN